MVLAHLQALATQGDPRSRQQWKVRIVKGLYGRSWTADDVRELFRVIDWMMELPEDLQEAFRNELYQFEEEQQMPYVTSIERMALKKGREEGRVERAARNDSASGPAAVRQGPDAQAEAQLEALTDPMDLERLTDRLLEASSWAELLATPV